LTARLRVTHGTNVGDVFDVGEQVVLGRVPEVEIQIHDNKASRKHTKVSRTDKTYAVEDLESRNGTLVNGHKIQRVELRHGDVIKIGATELVFEISGAALMAAEDKSAETETLQRPISSAVRRDALMVAPRFLEKRFDPAIFRKRAAQVGLWDDFGEQAASTKAMIWGGVSLALVAVGGLSYLLTVMALG
jgi:predicted component of type VI protein secretion system